MIVLGLTGSIGMGKSVAAAMLRQMGVPLHDADACVHELLSPGGLGVEPVAQAFASTLRPDGGIDRSLLGALVFLDAQARTRLESILHPLVHQDQELFLRRVAAAGNDIAVLDIPLLYETGAQARVDAVIVVSAPAFIQRQRVLRRPGMTAEKFSRICAAQMPDAKKRALADHVVQTGLGRAWTFMQLTWVIHCYRRSAKRRTKS